PLRIRTHARPRVWVRLHRIPALGGCKGCSERARSRSGARLRCIVRRDAACGAVILAARLTADVTGWTLTDPARGRSNGRITTPHILPRPRSQGSVPPLVE